MRIQFTVTDEELKILTKKAIVEHIGKAEDGVEKYKRI